MLWVAYVTGFLLLVALLVLLAAFVCYRLAFCVLKQDGAQVSQLLPRGQQYDPHREAMLAMVEAARARPYEEVWITSDDGLRLHGKYYHMADGAPVQIMLHGYRSMAEMDFSGGLRFALDKGWNALLVDQRAHGKSEGKCLTFGIKERYDCLAWANYAANRFGPDTPLLLYGMSMGAATVLMAAGLSLPPNVAGIIADCGYSSADAIIKKVLRELQYPVRLVFPLVRLGGMLFGGFDLQATSVSEAVKNCSIPTLLIHGEDDRFVPCEMSRTNFNCLAAENKRLLCVPHAGHGISYLADKNLYLNTVDDFLQSVLG